MANSVRGPLHQVALSVTDLDRSVKFFEEALALRLLARFEPPQLIHTDHAGTFAAPGTEEWMAFFEDPDANPLALVESRPTPAS